MSDGAGSDKIAKATSHLRKFVSNILHKTIHKRCWMMGREGVGGTKQVPEKKINSTQKLILS